MELQFEVTTAQVGSEAFIVSVTGEADLHSMPEIERELKEVLRLGGSSVAVDLVEVGFIDSTALGLMARYQPRFRARGGRLVLVTDDRRILRALEITGLDRILTVEQRLDQALGALQVDGLPAAKPA
jgi:anti-sigma B factor antagonist